MTDIDDGPVRGLDPAWGRVRPLVFRTIVGAVVAAGLVGIIAVLVGDFGLVAVQLLLTIVVVVVFALLSWYDADVSSRRSGAFALGTVVIPLSNALFSPRSETAPRVPLATWPSPTASWEAAPAPAPVPVAVAPSEGAPVDVAQPPVPVAVAAGDLVYEPGPGASRVLAWPRYVDGSPLPARADGSPDFSHVTRG